MSNQSNVSQGPPYSPFIKAGETFYTAGQLPLDAQGQIVGLNSIKEQTTQTIKNLFSLLEKNGYKPENLTSVSIFLKDIENDFALMNEAYVECFKNCKPARATVEAKLYKPELLIEIVAIADSRANNQA